MFNILGPAHSTFLEDVFNTISLDTERAYVVYPLLVTGYYTSSLPSNGSLVSPNTSTC